MRTHIRVLAVLQIVYASLGLAVGLGVLTFFGGLATLVGLSSEFDDLVVAVPILTSIGFFASSVLIILSVPGLIAGIGLMKHRPWARILSIVLCVLGLLEFPIGTAIGIYGLWVLFHRDTSPIFEDAGGLVAEHPVA